MAHLSKEDRLISENLQNLAEQLDLRLSEIAGKRMSFSLVVFNSEGGSRLNYVSNCSREDVTKAMVSLLTSWSGNMPDIKAHELNS